MNELRKKSEKTLQMKYLDFSQMLDAGANNRPTRKTSKPKKIAKPRVSSYSTPSWQITNKTNTKMRNNIKSMRPASSQQSAPRNKNRKKNEVKRPSYQLSTFRPRQSPPRRWPDPSARHLKYGLFPPRKPSGNSSAAQLMKPTVSKRATTSPEVRVQLRVKKKKQTSTIYEQDMSESEDYPPSEAPLQRLCSSGVAHMDIRPGQGRAGLSAVPRIVVF